MPILAAEPCGFPENLLTDTETLADRPGRWWAVYTKARAEKALARHLRGRGVYHYLPLERSTWKNHGRTFTSYLPLFQGYLFFHGDSISRVAALESNLVSRVLEVPDEGRFVRELQRVDRVLAADQPIEREAALLPGNTVEIIAGPFQGIEGKLIRFGSQLRLVVGISFLNQSISVEVAGWMVEPVRRSAMEKLPA